MNAAELLGPDGSFARELEDFVPRGAQREMAARVEQAIAERGILIAESGTGTGKTFAYLVPALMSGKRTLIATGTKALQDQLFHRDLPVVRARLAAPSDVALLKGRANYLCRERIKHAEPSRALSIISAWAQRTRNGDIAEVADVPEGAPVWASVTSTTDNCLGAECPEYDKCYVVKARREAQQATVVVVNHHLFFADLALREEGFGEILPGVETMIFDEAHQLAEIAGDFFGEAISTRQIAALAHDVSVAEQKEASTASGLLDAAAALEKSAQALRLAAPREARRGPYAEIADEKEFSAALAECGTRLEELATPLELAAPRGPALASCYRRACDLNERLARLCAGRGDSGHDGTVVWYETTARVLTLRATPVDIASRFRGHVFNGARAWIFTSATLAVGPSFAHFQARLGLQDADTAQWPSPFDFARNTLAYLPPGLPEPSDPGYTQAWLARVVPVLAASEGRAFLLFTSHRALKFAAEWLRTRASWPLLVQGAAPRAELLARFRSTDNAVLLGAASFWEGVDVRGPALSVVAIDKLPFATPDDPVFLARKRQIESDGGNAFFELQLPEAVIALKQGVGRLIRDVNDRGVIVLGDPRLTARNYGRVFLDSLPPMPRTHEIDDVRRFFDMQSQHDVA